MTCPLMGPAAGSLEMSHHWGPLTCLSLTELREGHSGSLPKLPVTSRNLAVALVPVCWGLSTSPGVLVVLE